jgi:hypothetical protein
METKNNKMLYILLGIGAGIGVYYFLCNRLKKQQSTTSSKVVEKTTEKVEEQ